MIRAFPIAGKILWIISSFIVRASDIDRLGAAPVEPDDERIGVKLRNNASDLDAFHCPHGAYNIAEQSLNISRVLATRDVNLPTATSRPIGIIEDKTNGLENEPDSSRDLRDIVITGRELELIHGHEALDHLSNFPKVFDKNLSTSIFDDFEAPRVYELFIDVLMRPRYSETRRNWYGPRMEKNVETSESYSKTLPWLGKSLVALETQIQKPVLQARNLKVSFNDEENLSGRKYENPPDMRSKRSVRMVDWLRAAQEYRERLRQVRNAALRTWLASREEIADTNLTDVKLFTRQIPDYPESLRPSFTVEDEDSMTNSETSEGLPMKIRDPRSSIDNDSEFLAESLLPIFPNATKDEQDSSATVNAPMVKKFIIIATGNSTLRIEESPEVTDGSEGIRRFVDPSAQDTINSELVEDDEIRTNHSDDFDHMYESVDAEDEDFDYVDPNLTLFRLDDVEIIDASSVELAVDKTKTIGNDYQLNDAEDYEVDELLSRSKRDSPLFLFEVKGHPRREVFVWPSNWKDFIDRRSKGKIRNSSGSSDDTKISKLESLKTSTLDVDSEISHSSAEALGANKDSSSKVDVARRVHAFDNRQRQKRRKNHGIRTGNGNYK